MQAKIPSIAMKSDNQITISMKRERIFYADIWRRRGRKRSEELETCSPKVANNYVKKAKEAERNRGNFGYRILGSPTCGQPNEWAQKNNNNLPLLALIWSLLILLISLSAPVRGNSSLNIEKKSSPSEIGINDGPSMMSGNRSSSVSQRNNSEPGTESKAAPEAIHLSSPSPPSLLSTASSFDRLASGIDDQSQSQVGISSTEPGNLTSDVDYILAAANQAATGSSYADAFDMPLTTETALVNGHQLIGDSPAQVDSNERHQEPRSSSALGATPMPADIGRANRMAATTTSSADDLALDWLSESSLEGDASTAPSITNESLSAQLIRNRKSPESVQNSTTAMPAAAAASNGSAPAPPSEQSSKSSGSGKSNHQSEKNQAKGQIATFSTIDYDDFDLDYQLKINTSEPVDSAEGGNLNLNKRDNNGTNNNKPPDWSALISRQPHVFSPSNTTNYFHHTPPIIPTLLTVKSTQLTNQELNKVRPHFMLYPDEPGGSAGGAYSAEQNQAFANGDLLATASASGVPLGASSALAGVTLTNGSTINLMQQADNHLAGSAGGWQPGSQVSGIGEQTKRGQDSAFVSLFNGSPVVRTLNNSFLGSLFGGGGHSVGSVATPTTSTGAPAAELQAPTSGSRQGGTGAINASRSMIALQDPSSTTTTIVVDNMAPTEPSVMNNLVDTPQFATTGQAQVVQTTQTNQTAAVHSSRGSDANQANQWFNYSHPSMNHNPLLFHHLLNKPSLYTQHLSATSQPAQQQQQQQQQQARTVKETSGSTGGFTTQTPMSAVSSPIPSLMPPPAGATSTNTMLLNIIEKPTLATGDLANQPAPINRTQLQMQLNEVRAIALANGMRQHQQPQQQSANVLVPPTTGFTQQQSSASLAPAQNGPLFTQAHQAQQQLAAWQKRGSQSASTETPGDFLSHLIGSRTRPNLVPSNLGAPYGALSAFANLHANQALRSAYVPSRFGPPQSDELANLAGKEEPVTVVGSLSPLTPPGAPPSIGQHQMLVPHAAANRLLLGPPPGVARINMMHHLFGNNLAGANYHHRALAHLHSKSVPLNGVQQQAIQLAQLAGKHRMFVPPSLGTAGHQLHGKSSLQFIDQIASGFGTSKGHQVAPLTQGLLKGHTPLAAGKLVTAPSLLQEVYAPRPASMISHSPQIAQTSTSAVVTPCPQASSQSADSAPPREAFELLKQLNHTASLRSPIAHTTSTLAELSRAPSQARLANTMSDEDMSTYVAQLASMSSGQVSGQPTSNWSSGGPQASNSRPLASSDLFSGLLSSSNGSTLTLLGDAPYLNELQASSSTNGQQSKASNVTLGPTSNDLESIIQRLIESLAQQAQANQIQQSQQQQQQQAGHNLHQQQLLELQQKLQQQHSIQANPWNEFLKHVKLIGLPEEVQAQLYRELGPLLQAPSAVVSKQAGPPYSTLMLSNGLASNKLPVFRPPGDITWRRPPVSVAPPPAPPVIHHHHQLAAHITPLGSATSDSQNYYSIDGHQKLQKKEREQQQQQQQQQAAAIQRQRQKQLAFIDALRSSVLKMHSSGIHGSDADVTSLSDSSSLHAGTNSSSSFTTDTGDLGSPIGESASLEPSFAPSGGGNSSEQFMPPAPSDDDFDEQSNNPIPDWLERQIIQESLVHETTRVHPLGQTTKTTFVGRHPPPPGLLPLTRPLAGHSVQVRPLGLSGPGGSGPRHLFPLHPGAREHLAVAAQSHQAHHYAPPPHFAASSAPGPLPPPIHRPLVHHPLAQHYHHHHHPATAPAPPPGLSMLTDGSQHIAAGNLGTSPGYPPAPIAALMTNPTKLLADRFPLVAAPAYLVKVPTLTGGTITAAGSIVTPSSKLAAMRHARPLRLLNAAALTMSAGAGMPPRLRLISSGLQAAPSMAAALHQAPPLAMAPHYGPPASHAPSHSHLTYGPPLLAAQSARLHVEPAGMPPSSFTFHSHHAPALRPLVVPPGGLPLMPLAYHQHPHYGYGTAAAPSGEMPLAGQMSAPDAQSMAQSSSELVNSQPGGPSAAGAPSSLAVSTTNRAPSSVIQSTGQQQQQPHLQLPPSGGSTFQTSDSSSNQPPGGQPLAGAPAAAHSTGPPSSTTALGRLQQATASLVELTSLASLVEEMVGGTDSESSPAIALANAINSISAAQNAALNAQASTTSGLQSSAVGATGSDGQPQQQQQHHTLANSNPFSWRSLLNPILWLDKSASKATALERLVAAGRRPVAQPVGSRLRVKYIRVPVAVYETGTGAEAIIDPTGRGLAGHLQLAAKGPHLSGTGNELGEPVSPGAGTGSSLTGSALAPPAVAPTAGGQSPSTGAAASGSAATSSSSSSTSTSTTQASSSSAADYLFDEMSLDSAPEIALAALSHAGPSGQLVTHMQPGTQGANGRLQPAAVLAAGGSQPLIRYLPMIGNFRAPVKPARLPVLGDLMNPLESALYYSLLETQASSPPASLADSLKLATSKPAETESKPPKKKWKKGKKDEEEDSDEEEEDDDLLSGNDLPLLESIISTLVHPPPAPSPFGPVYGAPAHLIPATGSYGANPWRVTSARNPFSGFRAETSNQVESYAHPLASGSSQHAHPFLGGKHSHRLSFGEVVGALGARKLISSLLNKRKTTSRLNNKRDLTANLLKDNQGARTAAAQAASSNISNKLTSVGGTNHLSAGEYGGNMMELPTSTTALPPVGPSAATTQASPRATSSYASAGSLYGLHLAASTSRRPGPASSKVNIRRKVAENKHLKPVIPVDIQASPSNSPNEDLSRRAISSTDTQAQTTRAPQHETTTVSAPSSTTATPVTERTVDTGGKPRGHKDQAPNKPEPEPEAVQFKFFLKPASGQTNSPATTASAKNGSDSSDSLQSGQVNSEPLSKRKMAMPLYHVVADHYSKLHSGSGFSAPSKTNHMTNSNVPRGDHLKHRPKSGALTSAKPSK